MTIGLLLIATGKYDVFLQPLIDSLASHFFVNNSINLYLFHDKSNYNLNLSCRFSVTSIPTPHKQFPYPTLYRYKYFSGAAQKIQCDYLFYIDVDMKLVYDVGEEIMPSENDGGLVAVGHPGFWKSGGSWCNLITSTAYTPENNRIKYCAGGFQGGETKSYLSACAEMAANIQSDEDKGIIVEWHDEMHWNKYLSTRKYKLLTPEYCMIEEIEPREKFGISNFAPKIIALKKNHDLLRSS